MNARLLLFLLLLACPLTSLAKIEIKDGDRVVFLGGGFVEREGKYGYLEAAMTAQWADRRVTFRNLGWSGDTVFGASRSYFGPPQQGFDRLRIQLKIMKPTVVIACYGQVASFDGDAGLEKFIDGYGRLIKMIGEASPGVRVVLLSPPPFESKGAPLPDMTERNLMLGKYRDRIRDLAKAEKCEFADLFGTIDEVKGLTTDGVQFGEPGYAALVEPFLAALGETPAEVSADQLEALREVIVEKNEIYFFRWRPQNETYLRGFRKHEQGKHAAELPMFDPLVEAKDEEISQLREALRK